MSETETEIRIETKVKLPEKLSDLIEVALADLELVEQDKNYHVNMGIWHKPNSHCNVCFAGAVMAKTLEIDEKVDADPYLFSDQHTANRLYALNEVRTGFLRDALKCLGKRDEHLPDDLLSYIRVTQYREDPEKFKRDMKTIISHLRQFNE